jgi:hypothetical protein
VKRPINMNLEAQLELRLSPRELARDSEPHDLAAHARRPVLIVPPTQGAS